MDIEQLAKQLIYKIETAITHHLMEQDLRLQNGMYFWCSRISNCLDYVETKPNANVFFIHLYFRGLTDQDEGEKISVAAGQWEPNTITYSLLDGPKSLVDFLHDYLGFGVSAVYERFEEFGAEYEGLQTKGA